MTHDAIASGWILTTWAILKSVIVIYLALVAFVYLFQRRMQYYPDRRPVFPPPDPAYSEIQDISFTTSDGQRLSAWYWPASKPVTLVLFHGNAGNRADRLSWIDGLHELGYGVLIPDYRGYGGSEGQPSEEGLYLDAQAAVKWLKTKSSSQVVYLGESLGSAVAVETALRVKPSSLILQSGFSSALAVASHVYPYLPVRLMMKDRYECLDKIPRIGCPLLMIHGEHDSVIPIRLGRALYDAAVEPKQWLSIPGADHNDVPWVGAQTYWNSVSSFLKQTTGH
ncbi:MAG: alpha/beta hydrolase [Acidobacteriota bacterium]